MTTEDDFHAHLDANPEDHHARMVFADYLDEQGDPRAAGYRALGKLRVYPWQSDYRHPPGWTRHSNYWIVKGSESGKEYIKHALPDDWHALIYPDQQNAWKFALGGGRRDADDAAAHAFAKLPPERQAELLADPVQMKRRVRYARKRRELQSTNKRNN